MSQTSQASSPSGIIIGKGSVTTDMMLHTPSEVSIDGIVQKSTIEASQINVRVGGRASGSLSAGVVIVEGDLENATIKAPQIFIADTANVSDCKFEVASSEGLRVSGLANLYGEVVFRMPPRKETTPGS